MHLRPYRRLGARRWAWAVVPALVMAGAVADGITAAWSPLAAAPYSWDRFGTVLFPALGGFFGASVGRMLLLAGALPSPRPEVRLRLDAERETLRALRRGVLPPDADAEQWRARLRRQVRSAAATGWSCAAACAAAAVLTAAAAHLANHDRPVLWAAAAAVLLPVAPALWLMRLTHRRARLLLRDL